jgi:hypothetical protein
LLPGEGWLAVDCVPDPARLKAGSCLRKESEREAMAGSLGRMRQELRESQPGGWLFALAKKQMSRKRPKPRPPTASHFHLGNSTVSVASIWFNSQPTPLPKWVIVGLILRAFMNTGANLYLFSQTTQANLSGSQLTL